MNKRQKIIVSIVGITIVLLALLGITYAYYLTRIQGNTNTNSLSITTADLKLVYGDGTTNILTKENIVPDNNNPVGTKDFTVTNTGNTTIDNYSVVLEYAVIDGVVPSVFVRPQDFEITLNCVDNEGNACNGTKVNFNNEAVTLTTSSIDPNEVHNYTLTIFYVDPGVNQSDDMGKNLNLKVQIYEVRETTDINGTITGVDDTYSVKLTSDPKISPVVKTSDGSYNYAFSGVEMGTHTLRVLNKDGEEVSNQKIVIQKGNSVGFSTTEVDEVEVPLITVNESNRVISLTTNVNTTSSTVTNSGTSVSTFNPYESNKNSLAYNIINKAKNVTSEQNVTGLAIYKETPITTPGKGEGNKVYTSYTDPTSFSSSSSYTSKWYVYGSEITMDKDGWFKIVNPQVGQFTSVATSMVGGYITTYSGYADEASAKKVMNNEFTSMYKVGDSTTTSKLYYKELTKVSENIESILSKTSDDHGTSYYYRGGVVDNYVNYAGMCWRVVRIVGDGSIKLILEDQYTTCDDTETETTTEVYTGNYVIGSGVYGYTEEYIEADDAYLYKINYLNYTGGMADSLKAYQTTLETKLKAIDENKTLSNTLKVGDWCYDDSTYSDTLGTNILEDTSSYYASYKTFYYGAYTRLYGNKTALLKCKNSNGESMTLNQYADETPMYVSALTMDEIAFAGGKNASNTNYYLINQYQQDNSDYWWALSPSDFYGDRDRAFIVNDYGGLYSGYVSGNVSFRPAVSLKSSTTIVQGGEGTKSNPYVIG